VAALHVYVSLFFIFSVLVENGKSIIHIPFFSTILIASENQNNYRYTGVLTPVPFSSCDVNGTEVL